MRGMKVFSAVMAALMFAGCGGDAGMAHQREDAGIPGVLASAVGADCEKFRAGHRGPAHA